MGPSAQLTALLPQPTSSAYLLMQSAVLGKSSLPAPASDRYCGHFLGGWEEETTWTVVVTGLVQRLAQFILLSTGQRSSSYQSG